MLRKPESWNISPASFYDLWASSTKTVCLNAPSPFTSVDPFFSRGFISPSNIALVGTFGTITKWNHTRPKKNGCRQFFFLFFLRDIHRNVFAVRIYRIMHCQCHMMTQWSSLFPGNTSQSSFFIKFQFITNVILRCYIKFNYLLSTLAFSSWLYFNIYQHGTNILQKIKNNIRHYMNVHLDYSLENNPFGRKNLTQPSDVNRWI